MIFWNMMSFSFFFFFLLFLSFLAADLESSFWKWVLLLSVPVEDFVGRGKLGELRKQKEAMWTFFPLLLFFFLFSFLFLFSFFFFSFSFSFLFFHFPFFFSFLFFSLLFFFSTNSLFVLPTAENLALTISNLCTKLAILCKPPAQVIESKQMVEELTRAILAMTTVSRSISLKSGQTYLSAVQQTTRAILLGVGDLANSFRRSPEELEADHQIYLKPTGTVWLAKDVIQKMPRNNVEAVLVRYEEGGVVASDALNETETLLKRLEKRLAGETTLEEDEDMDDWGDDWDEGGDDEMGGGQNKSLPVTERRPVTEVQLQGIRDCISLVKMAKMLLQKTALRSVKPTDLAAGGAEGVIPWLDGLATTLEEVLEQIDELCTYVEDIGEDGGFQVVHEKAQNLNAAMGRLVELVKQRLEESHLAWYDQFVTKAASIVLKLKQE